jgi:hypothetical protein
LLTDQVHVAFQFGRYFVEQFVQRR